MKKLSCLFACLIASSATVDASVITSLYGDIDGGYAYDYSAEGITDRGLGGDRSWTQNFTLDGLITSATVELGTGALGFYPPSTGVRLILDGIILGNLTDTDACDGSAAPGYTSCSFSNYATDLLNIASLSSLSDGVANFRIDTGSGDGWFLDYSKITITTDGGSIPVPAPATLPLMAFGLIALRYARKKNVK